MSGTLAVFAKRPFPGRVKTRLTSRWTAEQAAELYWAMVQDTWLKVAGMESIQPVLYVDEYCEEFTELAAGSRVCLQLDGDLGSRMYTCLEQLTAGTLNPTLIIGTDSPSVPAKYLEGAFSTLSDANDAVLGPTDDGGYYLVGCRHPHPKMFEGVTWSTESTLTETRDAFGACGFRTQLAPPWWDVDTPGDVGRLSRSAGLGPRVSEWLRGAGEFPANTD